MTMNFYNFIIFFLIFIISLLSSLKYTKFFNFIVTVFILILIPFYKIIDDQHVVISIYNLKLINDINLDTKLIGFVFIFVTYIANLYGISQNKKMEVIIGSSYCLASLIALFAGDFISLFVGLEFMMLTATMLIFIGNNKKSIRDALRYFLIHFTSSSLMLIGISYIISKTGSTEIVLLTKLIEHIDKGFLFYILILISCLINIACVPFSGWMINCYPKSSSTGFIYLITFTTKVSIVILIKLFSGFEGLKFCGIIMMLYGGLYACIEENLRKILCYLTLSQLGFMLIFMGDKTVSWVYSYIPIHILYTTLFAIILAILQDVANIENSSQIKNIKNFAVKTSLLIGILTIINFPFTTSFLHKLLLHNITSHDLIYYLMLLTNSMIFLAMPFREYFITKETLDLELNGSMKQSLFIITFSLIIGNILAIKNLFSEPHFSVTNHIITESAIKQFAIVTIGIILSFIVKISRKSTIFINFDLFQLIGNSFNHICVKTKQNNDDIQEETGTIYKRMLESILDQIYKLHNQPNAIFIVFSLLIILILMSC